MARIALTSALMLAAGSASFGQITVYPPVHVSPPNPGMGEPERHDNWEPAITASRINPNKVVVVWQAETPTGLVSQLIFYAVSEDGGLSFTLPKPVAIPVTTHGCVFDAYGDPMVAALADGALLVGGLTDRNFSGDTTILLVARVPLLDTSVDTGVQILVCGPKVDKPFMAAGPWPPFLGGVPVEAAETVHVAYRLRTAGVPNDTYGVHSTGAVPTEFSWWEPGGGTFGEPKPVAPESPPWTIPLAIGAFPKVMHGGTNPGRVIVAAGFFELPKVVVSDTGGESIASMPNEDRWKFPDVLDSYVVGANVLDIFPLPIGGPSQHVLPGGADARVFPNVAESKTNPDEVAIAFIDDHRQHARGHRGRHLPRQKSEPGPDLAHVPRHQPDARFGAGGHLRRVHGVGGLRCAGRREPPLQSDHRFDRPPHLAESHHHGALRALAQLRGDHRRSAGVRRQPLGPAHAGGRHRRARLPHAHFRRVPRLRGLVRAGREAAIPDLHHHHPPRHQRAPVHARPRCATPTATGQPSRRC